MKDLIRCALAIGALLAPAGVHVLRAQEKPEALAQRSAEAWLTIIDSGRYGDSWDEAAEMFRSAVTKEQWEKAAGSVRTQTGKLQARKLVHAEYTRNLPNAPEGEYVVLQYDASFANGGGIETVVPTRDRDGAWRVSGYFVKPKK